MSLRGITDVIQFFWMFESHHHQRLAWKDAAQMRITRQRAEAASAAQLESMRNANPSGALGDSCLNDPRNLEQSGLL